MPFVPKVHFIAGSNSRQLLGESAACVFFMEFSSVGIWQICVQINSGSSSEALGTLEADIVHTFGGSCMNLTCNKVVLSLQMGVVCATMRGSEAHAGQVPMLAHEEQIQAIFFQNKTHPGFQQPKECIELECSVSSHTGTLKLRNLPFQIKDRS